MRNEERIDELNDMRDVVSGLIDELDEAYSSVGAMSYSDNINLDIVDAFNDASYRIEEAIMELDNVMGKIEAFVRELDNTIYDNALVE